jgi:hypothetical protein
MNDIWTTYFDRIHCDATTKQGTPCKMTPIYSVRLTGQRLCYVHAIPEYERFRVLDRDPEIVLAR